MSENRYGLDTFIKHLKKRVKDKIEDENYENLMAYLAYSSPDALEMVKLVLLHDISKKLDELVENSRKTPGYTTTPGGIIPRK